MIETKVVVVLDDQADEFEKGLNKLNKKAARFGLPLISIEGRVPVKYAVAGRSEAIDGAEATIRETRLIESDGSTASLRVIREMGFSFSHFVSGEKTSIKYPIVKNGDWAIVGMIDDSLGRESRMLFNFTENEADRAGVGGYACNPITCDHCKKDRNRNSAMVLRSLADGRFMEVGGSCLEDFTGIDPGAALFLAEMASFSVQRWDSGDYQSSGGGRNRFIPTNEFLARSCFLSDVLGFVTKKAAIEKGIPPTSEVAAYSLATAREYRKLYGDFLESYEKYMARADEIIGYFKDIDPKVEFEWNMRSIARTDMLPTDTGRYIGVGAYLVEAYRKIHDRADAAFKDGAANSNHLGAASGKLSGIQLSLESRRFVHGDWGSSFVFKMRTPEGDVVEWKTASPPQCLHSTKHPDPRGVVLVGDFTIKAHGEWKGEKKTEIARLKVTRVISHPDKDIEGWEAEPKKAPSKSPRRKAAPADTQVKPADPSFQDGREDASESTHRLEGAFIPGAAPWSIGSDESSLDPDGVEEDASQQEIERPRP